MRQTIAVLIVCYGQRPVQSRIVLLCGAITMLALSGCGGGEPSGRERADDRTVVAAFYPLAFAAERVAPAGTEVQNLTPPGAEPHDLELTARDVGRLRDATLVVYVGEGFQPAIDSALEGRDGPSLDVLDGLDLLAGGEHEDEAVDPHVWLDPMRYATVARAIAAALGKEAAADPLVERLVRLDREFRQGLRQCRRREIVTSHAAFGYLAHRYGLEQIPLVGISPESEPSPKEIERLVRRVRETGATTVFFETLVSPDLARTVAREAGATTAVLDPVEGLEPATADAGADYFTVMRKNLAALRKALECT
jgi:zinc transport system substrate-binding protein